MSVRAATATLAMLALCACACSSGRSASGPPANAAGNGPSKTVLLLGGRSSDGDGIADRLRDAWPYRVFDALPRSTVFVNNARDQATVAEALSEQVPLSRDLKPDLVEVWLGADDVAAGTPLPAFMRDLSRLIVMLRAAGAGRILVGDLPPAYGAATARYNDAIHRVVRDGGAELVSLSRAGINLGSPREGRLPDAASQPVIAAAFTTAINAHS
ncbi:MAG TPA: SGNH/GDSL hydrolase family protein [Acidimicrobiia bacterium]|nr:SGNH/GDSL hydrolase family protein [Acidimicrobiia bacterium]